MLCTCLHAVVTHVTHQEGSNVQMPLCTGRQFLAEPGTRLGSVKRDGEQQAVPVQPPTTCSPHPCKVRFLPAVLVGSTRIACSKANQTCETSQQSSATGSSGWRLHAAGRRASLLTKCL